MASLPVEKFAADTELRSSIWRGIWLFAEKLESKQHFFLGFWSVELDPELTLPGDKVLLQSHGLWGSGKWEVGLKTSWFGLYNGSSIVMLQTGTYTLGYVSEIYKGQILRAAPQI